MCCPAEVNIHRKITLQHIPQGLEILHTLDDLCEEYKDIFSLHLGDIGHPKLLTINIDMGDYLPIVHKPYMLALKHTPWVWKEMELLQKAGIISSVSPQLNHIVIVLKEGSTRRVALTMFMCRLASPK